MPRGFFSSWLHSPDFLPSLQPVGIENHGDGISGQKRRRNVSRYYAIYDATENKNMMGRSIRDGRQGCLRSGKSCTRAILGSYLEILNSACRSRYKTVFSSLNHVMCVRMTRFSAFVRCQSPFDPFSAMFLRGVSEWSNSGEYTQNSSFELISYR